MMLTRSPAYYAALDDDELIRLALEFNPQEDKAMLASELAIRLRDYDYEDDDDAF